MPRHIFCSCCKLLYCWNFISASLFFEGSWSYEVLTSFLFCYLKDAIFSLLSCSGQVHSNFTVASSLKDLKNILTWVTSERGVFLHPCHSLIIPLGHWGRLPWGNFDILLNRKGFPINVTVIGHPLLCQSCIHLPWALGKFRLCNNNAH